MIRQKLIRNAGRPILKDALRDDCLDVRCAALIALGKACYAGDADMKDLLQTYLADKDNRARSRLPQGESALECDECGTPIPEAWRKVVPGVRLCVSCQETIDEEQAAFAGYNRRGSKDSQLR